MRVFFLMIALFLGTISNAQKTDCSKQTKEYKEFLVENNFADAVSAWEFVIKNCPKQSVAIYTDGISIKQYQISVAKTQEDKEKSVRETMKLYDQFYKNFPENAPDFEVKKAMLLVDNAIDAKEEIFNLFENGFAKAANKVEDANTIHNYFKIYNQKFTDGDKKITIDKYIEKYIQLHQQLKGLLVSNPSHADEYNAALRSLRSESRKIINCENLADYCKKNSDANAENPLWFENSLELLSSKCNSNPMFLAMAEKYYALEKTAKSAGFLALASVKNRKFDDAKKYYEEAANLETNPAEKAQIYYNIGMALYSNDLPKTKGYLNKAVELNPKLTQAYIFLSQMYANHAEKCGKDDFEKRAIYYLAIQTAKKALVNDDKKTTLTVESITKGYASKALTSEEIQSKKLWGKTYKIECDINETIVFPAKK